jgi:membrane-associated protease RseP (regulator of RpoE activity)
MSNDPIGFPAPLGVPPRYEPARLEPQRLSSRPPAPQRTRAWLHLVLFGLTLLSMQATSMMYNQGGERAAGTTLMRFAAYQALPLLGILLVHELGHYVASLIHRVPASPPYFLPLPFVSLFGTLGALITMNDRIRSRKALLDIGAAGPIAGMLVAIPVLCIGLSMSTVQPRSLPPYTQEGQSILYWLLKRAVLGPIPADHDVFLHPMAFAGWGGFFLTMINLLPWGQLDGGHIAYALLGERQHRIATWVRRGLLLAFTYNLYALVLPVVLQQSQQGLGMAIGNSMFWLVWYGITGAMARFAGADHPPFEPAPLDLGRKLIAVACLVLFVLLFLPTPLASYY